MSPPAAAAAARAPSPARPHERTLAPPSRPRRISGPSRPKRAAGPARRARQGASAAPVAARRGLAQTLAAALARLAEHRLLTRLIAGKAWIAVVAFALIGIVTLQLGLLRLNTSIGRALEREGTLQRENAALSIENSQLAAGERVESQAAQLGMQLVPEGALRFLDARGGGSVGRALGALASPVQAREGGESSSSSSSSSSSTTTTTTGESSATGGSSTAGGEPSATAGTSAAGESGASGAGTRREGESAGESAAARGGPSEAHPSSEASAATGASEAGSGSSQAGEGSEGSAAGGAGSGPEG